MAKSGSLPPDGLGDGLDFAVLSENPAGVSSRFERGWSNFTTVYRVLATARAVYDNSGERPVLLEKSE